MIEISKIRIDERTQARSELNQETVAEYAEAYISGANMPPVVIYFDGSTYWLADGYHRFFGAQSAGLVEIYEEIIPGTIDDAILHSLGANSKHGLRRTNADKRKAVMTMLDHSVWSTWSSNEIAKRCAVHHSTVDEIRRSILRKPQDREPEVRTVERNGKTYEQNVTNIGKKHDQHKEQEIEQTATHEDNVETEYTELDAAKDQISDLQDALAVSSLAPEDKQLSADLISGLRNEIRILTATIDAVKASRDAYQNENAQLKKQVQRQRKEIDKLTGTRTA